METRWLTDEEQRLWRLFIRSGVLVSSRLNSQLQHDSNISDSDYGVLANLSEAPGERLRGYELADVLQWEKSRLSHHVTRMAARGLIRREHCPSDKRGAYIVLTDAGRELIHQAAPHHVTEVRRLFFDSLTARQQSALADALGAMVAHLETETSSDADADRPDVA